MHASVGHTIYGSYETREAISSFGMIGRHYLFWEILLRSQLRSFETHRDLWKQRFADTTLMNVNGLDIMIYPVLCPKLTLIQPTWSAYPYHLVFLIWYPYSLVFLIWYPYALISLYGNTAHCSGCGVAMGCYGPSIVPRPAIVTSQWYDRNCFTGFARTWATHPTTPWQRECTAITDFHSIDSL